MELQTIINLAKNVISPQNISSDMKVRVNLENTLTTIQIMQKTMVVENG